MNSTIGWSAVRISAAVERREVRAQDVTAACIERIEACEPRVMAWACTAFEQALQQARRVDAGHVRGLLAGVPIGIKDIIDTAGLPTTYGSSIYRDNRPPVDAACVALTREAGGIVMGKTVTTEFAYFEPGPTANPHNPAHTPGGSSSGSAAAVASGMVPLAFGSQTAGSLIRPASYCGVWALKPTHGVFSLAGVKGMAQSLDTLGWFARSVEDLGLLRAALLRDPTQLTGVPTGDPSPRIGLCRTPDWGSCEPESKRALDFAAQTLRRAGAQVFDLALPVEFSRLTEAQRTVQAFEAARSLSVERTGHRERLSASMRALLDQGSACPSDTYVEALRLAIACRGRLSDLFRSCDAVLAPSAPGHAPRGLGATGDPVFSRMWTLLQVPCLNVPVSRDGESMPVGVQLIGNTLHDRQLLQLGQWVEQRLDIRLEPIG